MTAQVIRSPLASLVASMRKEAERAEHSSGDVSPVTLRHYAEQLHAIQSDRPEARRRLPSRRPGAGLKFEEAAVLVDGASQLLALGNRLDTIARHLADAGAPPVHYHPLTLATGFMDNAMEAIFRSLEAVHADGGGPFCES